MSAIRFAIVASLLLAGCGRAPVASAPAPLEERRVTYISLKPDQTVPRAKEVEGIVYPEHLAPAPFVTPEPATAPAAGKGHLRLFVSLRGLSGSAAGLIARVDRGGENLWAEAWGKDQLRGSALGAIAADLPPGEYKVAIDFVHDGMLVYKRRIETVTVAPDSVVDAKF